MTSPNTDALCDVESGGAELATAVLQSDSSVSQAAGSRPLPVATAQVSSRTESASASAVHATTATPTSAIQVGLCDEFSEFDVIGGDLE